jgi:hypothetical protein
MALGGWTVKRDIPLVITFFCGMLMVTDWHFNIPQTKPMVSFLRNSTIILAAFIVGTGAVNLYRRFGRRLMTNIRRSEYSVNTVLDMWLLFVLTIFIISGLYDAKGSTYLWLYDTLYFPPRLAHQAIWFVAPACYRFLRARNIEAFIITLGGFIGLMASSPLWMTLTPWITPVDSWISKYLTSPVYRGFWIGIGLGSIGVSIRTILGIETAYLGRLVEEEVAR